MTRLSPPAPPMHNRPATPPPRPAGRVIPAMLITISLAYLTLFLFLPLITVFTEALRKGFATYAAAYIAVPLNLVFGLCAAWAIAKFEFRGKRLLITLIDIPLAVSPVISGMIYVLLYGGNSLLGARLLDADIQIIFAVPGIVLATIFVTLPFVARETIPLMEAQGIEEEQAAMTLGAGPFQTFFRVTLPNVKWAVLYGVILCNARAMGEFGAVSVVSGHIRGKTNTLPLHVEILYNEYNFVAAFAMASLLTLLALMTLLLKSIVEHRSRHAAPDPVTRIPTLVTATPEPQT